MLLVKIKDEGERLKDENSLPRCCRAATVDGGDPLKPGKHIIEQGAAFAVFDVGGGLAGLSGAASSGGSSPGTSR
ncbi:MAG: hypothetical protein D6768_07590 [Chloroflexi bacterium]|nr:MAG: hypothetical protein D6768_07590 [Chloroflexota bacterium]